MIPSSSSPTTPTFSSAAGASSSNAGQQVQESSESSTYARMRSFFDIDDDDEIYIICRGSQFYSPLILKEEVIEKLRRDYPGKFDDPYGPNTFFYCAAGLYQPLAKLIRDNPNLESIFDIKLGKPDLYVEKIPYAIYEHGFYEVIEDAWGKEWVVVDHDGYDTFRKKELFVPRLREFLFDESMSSDHKIESLKGLFPPIGPGEKDVSIEQLSENMDFLFGDTFKKAQQRAIEAGFKP